MAALCDLIIDRSQIQETPKSKNARRRTSMAQREEETEFCPHETRVLCVNNCGFPGSPATNNMCQSCFQDAAASSRPSPAGSAPPTPIHSADPPGPSLEEKGEPAAAATEPRSAATVAAPPTTREVNRCLVCWKRVRLTRFRCRCGELFCSEHRYSDRHDCSFDYKAAARAAIARANPTVRASKIARI